MFGIFGFEDNGQKKIHEIELGQIHPNPNQPRTVFDAQKLEELAQSIRTYGVIQPILVRRLEGRAEYEIIGGERRYRACEIVGKRSIPCIVHDAQEQKSSEIALIENLQRENLTFFDEALAMQKLIEQYGMTQEELAKKIGKKQSTIANKLRILSLSKELKEIIMGNALTERHARILLKLPEKMRREVLDVFVKKELNVAQAERFVQEYIEKKCFENVSKKGKNIVIFKDLRIFLNTINKALSTMNSAGIKATAKKTENEEYIEYIINIPKKTG